MSEITVRPLGEDDWQQYRAARLAALTESPEAFVATAEQEQAYDEARWRDRMRRSARLLARSDDDVVGVASVGMANSGDGSAGELFGLWVRPQARGTGVATQLVNQSAAVARDRGQSHLVYWVSTDNGRAVAFASGIGFRPTDLRRPMRLATDDDGDEEIAMLLPLGQDVGPQPRL